MVQSENSVVVIGAGNLATNLAIALRCVNITISAIWSRSEESASLLAKKIDVPCFTDLSLLPIADIFVVSVSDDALPQIAATLSALFPKSLLVHTAGSLPLSLWSELGVKRCGVFYPLQTFSKNRVVDFSKIPIFVEAGAREDENLLLKMAMLLSENVRSVSGEQRACLHLAAVFACNFTNAMYRIAADMMQDNGLNFNDLVPLINETTNKLKYLSPTEAQTGPAARGDKEVMKMQQGRLNGEIAEIYELMSRNICDYHKRK